MWQISSNIHTVWLCGHHFFKHYYNIYSLFCEQYTTILYLSVQQSKLSPRRCCEWPYALLPEANIFCLENVCQSLSAAYIQMHSMLTLKAPLIICSRQKIPKIAAFSKITNKGWYFMRIVCWQTILMKCHSLFLMKIRKDVTKFVVCCSSDWRFKS